MSPEFEQQIVDLLPKMRAWAWYLTHDVTAADDLVQDVALKTLSAFESFTPGTNFSAWVRKIMNNHFMSSIRQKREMTTLEHMPEIPVAEAQQDQTNIRELGVAFDDLPKAQKDVLHLIAIQEQSYEEVSLSMGVAIGTLKSRVHRARLQLRARTNHEASVSA